MWHLKEIKMSSRGPISKISNKCGAKTLPFFWYNLIFSTLLFKVIWTDVFQLFFMFLSTAYIIAVATQQAGGPAKVRDTLVFVMTVTLPMMMK